MDKQREAFEMWWKYNRPDYGEDYHPDMQYHAWNAWQAAVAYQKELDEYSSARQVFE